MLKSLGIKSTYNTMRSLSIPRPALSRASAYKKGREKFNHEQTRKPVKGGLGETKLDPYCKLKNSPRRRIRGLVKTTRWRRVAPNGKLIIEKGRPKQHARAC
jgi:hypothetical protein